LRADDLGRGFGAVLRGLAAFRATRLAVAVFATFADVLGVLLAIPVHPRMPTLCNFVIGFHS
jgi:hypothetical protein